MKIYILLLSLLICFTSCVKKDVKLIDNHYGSSVLLSKKTQMIDIDENTLSTYQILSTYWDKTEEDYIIGYNGSLHSLDIFSVKNKTVSHVGLKAEGQDGIFKQVSGIHVHNMDSIWLYSQNMIYLTDTTGHVKNKIALPFPQDGFIKIDTNFSMATNNIYYHVGRKSIFYLTVIPTKTGANYEVYEYKLDSDRIQSYPLAGSSLEEKAGRNFGWKQFPNVSYTTKQIVYNFPISSNLYCIDIDTYEKTSYGGQSKYTPNIVSELIMPYSFQDADKHLLENVHFFNIQHDGYKDVYYRLHLGETDFKGEGGFNELYCKKKLYLTVFNSNFEIINETELDIQKYNYINYWGILSNGFFIGYDMAWNQSMDENTFQFDVFDIIKDRLRKELTLY